MHSRWNSGLALVAAALAFAAAGAAAEEAPSGPPAQDPPTAAPPVALDKLFELPPSVKVSAPSYGGATRREWQARFDEVRAKRDEAQSALDKAQEELGELAADTSQWQMNAPGLGGLQAANGDNGPLSYRLHQEIRRQREELARADRQLQDLRVEANLAGVPREWMDPEPEVAPATADGAPATPAPTEASP